MEGEDKEACGKIIYNNALLTQTCGRGRSGADNESIFAHRQPSVKIRAGATHHQPGILAQPTLQLLTYIQASLTHFVGKGGET